MKKFVARTMLPRCDILAESVRCQFDPVTSLIQRQFAIPSGSEVVFFGKAFGSLRLEFVDAVFPCSCECVANGRRPLPRDVGLFCVHSSGGDDADEAPSAQRPFCCLVDFLPICSAAFQLRTFMTCGFGELLLIKYHKCIFGGYINQSRNCGVHLPRVSSLCWRRQ